MNDEEEITLWVRTVPAPDGSTYMGVIELSADTVVALDDVVADRLSKHIIEACVRAEFDCKVFQQMSEVLLVERNGAIQTVLDLRETRPFMDVEGLPFVMAPNVNGEGKPYLVVQIDNEPVGQLELPEAYNLAQHVASVPSWVERDNEYYTYLLNEIEVSEDIARATVDALSR